MGLEIEREPTISVEGPTIHNLSSSSSIHYWLDCVCSCGSWEYNHGMMSQHSANSTLIRVSLHLVGAFHGYILRAHLNEHRLLNNLTSSKSRYVANNDFMVYMVINFFTLLFGKCHIISMRLDYCIQAYLSFMQHKNTEVLCNMTPYLASKTPK